MRLTLAQIMSNEHPKNANETLRGLHKANDRLTILLPPGSTLETSGLTQQWIDGANEILTEDGQMLKAG
jgi:hypothetical protein